MKLTQFTDYGLRVLMALASGTQKTWKTFELSSSLHVSHEHLVKIIRHLSRGGFVLTQRGAGGGVCLALPANGMQLGVIVRWLEGSQGMVACMRDDRSGCNLEPVCLLRGLLEDASRSFYDRLNRYTLADCLHPPLHQQVAALRRSVQVPSRTAEPRLPSSVPAGGRESC